MPATSPPSLRTASPAAAPALDADGVVRLRQAVLRLARRIRQNVDSGTTIAQLSALATIARHGTLSLGDLAAAEHVRPSTMTKIVAALETAGLVRREVDPADRRVALVTVAQAGRELLQRSRTSAASYLAERVATLAPHDAAALAAALPALEQLVGEGGDA